MFPVCPKTAMHNAFFFNDRKTAMRNLSIYRTFRTEIRTILNNTTDWVPIVFVSVSQIVGKQSPIINLSHLQVFRLSFDLFLVCTCVKKKATPILVAIILCAAYRQLEKYFSFFLALL